MILTVCANPSVDSFWVIDQIQKGTANRSSEETFYPGGKGIHTALALNELGRKVATLGLWGGQMGQWLKKECNQRDIATIGPTVDGWSRLCITLRSDTGWNETELLGAGPTADPESVTGFKQIYTNFLQNNTVEVILISGSVPNGFSDQLYAEMVAEAHKHNVPAFVDASSDLLNNTLEALPYGIHINHKEGKQISGKEDPVAIVQWLHNFCSLAAVTAGSDGLYLAHENELFHSTNQIDENEIISTIGAGDCLLAGLALATLDEERPKEWARFAAACGSANCIHPQLGMLKKEIVASVIDQVNVEKL